MSFKMTNFDARIRGNYGAKKKQAGSGPGIRLLLATAVFGITLTSSAETLSFPPVRIEIGDGWIHSVEKDPQAHDETGAVLSIYHPDGSGVLKLQTYRAPDLVGKETLRNMTNVDPSISLTWQDWGDFSGYQHDYSERGSFFRQWWLANDRTLIFIVYESDTESRDIEIAEINSIVDSITVYCKVVHSPSV